MLSADEIATRVGPVLGDFPEIAAAWLFGSFARGTATLASDVDVAVLLAKRSDRFLDHERRLRALAARLEAATGGRDIDLVVLGSQGPIFCHRVLAEGRLVHDADRERRFDFESYIYTRYFDFQPTYRIAAESAVEGLKHWLDSRR